MWPQALQLSRDECRGILRRLELESYSHVISVFRAQGGLTDSKQKILEELRGIFHIPLDRHRAEARRAANDEQLCTIAEAISGPNTWQEWSREGRRSFPMLPRVAPQTALALIANNVANESAAENSKLPYPSETGVAVLEEADALAIAREAAGCETERSGYVVTSDPFKMPEIPMTGMKKNLKRNMIESHQSGNSHKKRHNADSGSYAGGHNNKRVHQENELDMKRLQQQRFFHHQLQKHKAHKLKSATSGKQRQATPAKSGRKSQKQLQKHLEEHKLLEADFHQQQQRLHHQQQQHHLSPVQPPLSRTIPYMGNIVTQGCKDSLLEVVRNADETETANALLGMPQIAASKKDITKNLNKLQLPVSGLAAAGSPQQIVQVQGGNLTLVGLPHSPVNVQGSPMVVSNKGDLVKPQATLSTPVKKYIVEERQAAAMSPTPTSAAAHQQQQQQQTPQTLQIQMPSNVAASSASAVVIPSAAATSHTVLTKLRGVNTAILPPGTKITAKKLPASAILSPVTGCGEASNLAGNQPQVFNVTDIGAANSSTASASTTTTTTTILTTHNNPQTANLQPVHTPPAVIQLHGESPTIVSMASSSPLTSATVSVASPLHPTQGKVLTTKLVPVILSQSGATSPAGGSGVSSVSASSMATTIIKNIPATMLLTSQASTPTSGTIISTIGPSSNTTVFRKNIIKTNIIGVNASNAASKLPGIAGGPQILSNIRLPATQTSPLNVTGTLTSSAAASAAAAAQQLMQQQLKHLTPTRIRTNVKICPMNGKVFIQPANAANVLDASKLKIQTANLTPTKLISSGVPGSGGQRVNIQKVEIIQGPTQQQTHQGKTTTLTIGGNKTNMIFMPATGAGGRVSAASFVAAKGGSLLTKAGAESPGAGSSVKPNVVVIGSVQALAHSQQQQQSGLQASPNSSLTLKASSPVTSNKSLVSFANQIITEDTPMDILNMPIIVDDGGNTQPLGGASPSIGDTLTVLPMDSPQQQHTTSVASLQTVSASSVVATGDSNSRSVPEATKASAATPTQTTIFSSATDWEMELDQATAASASKAMAKQSPAQATAIEDASEDNYEDVIVEEQDTMDSTTANEMNELDERGEHEQTVVEEETEKGEMIEVDEGQVEEAPSSEVTEAPKTHGDYGQEGPSSSAGVNSSEAEHLGETMIHVQASEDCETDAGFDETIEVDENHAMEYYEVDQPLTGDESEATNAEPHVDESKQPKDMLDDNQDSQQSVASEPTLVCNLAEKAHDDDRVDDDEEAAIQIDKLSDGTGETEATAACVSATPAPGNAMLIA